MTDQKFLQLNAFAMCFSCITFSTVDVHDRQQCNEVVRYTTVIPHPVKLAESVNEVIEMTVDPVDLVFNRSQNQKLLVCLLLLLTLLHYLVFHLIHFGLHLSRHAWHVACLSLRPTRPHESGNSHVW